MDIFYKNICLRVGQLLNRSDLRAVMSSSVVIRIKKTVRETWIFVNELSLKVPRAQPIAGISLGYQVMTHYIPNKIP